MKQKVFLISFIIIFAVSAAYLTLGLLSSTKAPDFTAQASLNGKPFTYKLSDALKSGPVVLYFYPAAFTKGCSIQAREFAKNIELFKANNASVIGISLDTIDTLNAFSADPDFCAGKVPVASDEGGKIARSFGVPIKKIETGVKNDRGQEISHGLSQRDTFIIDSSGTIIKRISGLAPAENVAQAIEEVKRLNTTN